MEPAEYARIAAAEDDHWWYRATRALIAGLLAPSLSREQRLLDAGCGPGGNGAWLAAHGTLVGVDAAEEALAFVRMHHPGTRPVRADLTSLPLAGESIDVAVAVTALYAVPDDRAALGELARVLTRGGTLLLLEPAFPMLRRRHDRTVHGVRRYRRPGLTAAVESAGLRVERATYAYSFLVPAAALLALADRMRPRTAGAGPDSDVERGAFAAVFARLARVEAAWIAAHDLGLGTSLVVVATRT